MNLQYAREKLALAIDRLKLMKVEDGPVAHALGDLQQVAFHLKEDDRPGRGGNGPICLSLPSGSDNQYSVNRAGPVFPGPERENRRSLRSARVFRGTVEERWSVPSSAS